MGKSHLFALLRGNNPWNEYSFDASFVYSEPTAAYVPSPILHIDAESGKVFEAFGDDLLVLPHGLSVAKNGAGKPTALWVTDLAHHQVMKFSWNNWSKPSMVLGKHGKPGNDEKSFCQPTDVAVASTVIPSLSSSIYSVGRHWKRSLDDIKARQISLALISRP